MEKKPDEIELERKEWRASFDYVQQQNAHGCVRHLIRDLQAHAHAAEIELPHCVNTPYINSIPLEKQPPYPDGNRNIEHRIKSLMRWNAMAMVVRANRAEAGIGGHISTFASPPCSIFSNRTPTIVRTPKASNWGRYGL